VRKMKKKRKRQVAGRKSTEPNPEMFSSFRYQLRAGDPFKESKRRIPVCLIAVLVINVAMMIAEIVVNGGFSGSWLGFSTDTLLELGGLYPPEVRKGQVWRLFTAMFLHIGLLHLLTNAVALALIGTIAERNLGSARFVIVYIISGISGNITSIAFNEEQLLVGASGAIFGLLGFTTVEYMLYRKVLIHPIRSALLLAFSVLSSFAFGLLPGFDNFCHFGGYLSGFFAAMVVFPSVNPRILPSINRTNVVMRFVGATLLPCFDTFFAIVFVFYPGLLLHCTPCYWLE
jgi:membrane associated rhomboid family serine protease